MKIFKLCFLLTILTISNSLDAQYLNFYVGVKSPDFKSSNIQLSYRDESPAPDVFNSNKSIKNELFYSFGISYDNFSHDKEVYANVIGNLYVGELFGVNLGLTIGYPFYVNKKKNISFLPALTTGIAYTNKDMGELINTTGYIQVNETKFGTNQNVDVSLAKTDFILRPNLSILIDVSPTIQLRLIGNYLFDINIKQFIDFQGKDNSGKYVSDNEEANATNISYYVNGSKSEEIPFSIRGFEIGLGFAINLGIKKK
ncbi:MAG: hypothetical protein IPM96_17555 [Ignavibacteria bacterium]|nr:hypothetical protein [Ignavibacteria bacterium]